MEMENVCTKKDAKSWQWIGIALLISAWAYFLFAVNKMPNVAEKNIKQAPAPVEVVLSQATPAQPILEPLSKPEHKKATNKSDKLINNLAGRYGATIKINATYEDRNQVFGWLLKNGGRIFMLDAQGYLLAEANEHGKLQEASNEIGKGKLRQATADIATFMQVPLPEQTKYAAVWWPDDLWKQIVFALKDYETHSATIVYKVTDDVLHVTIRQVITAYGIINPDKVVRIRQG